MGDHLLHWYRELGRMIRFNVLSLSGALNHQTAHHLFPGVLQYYYPQITPIIQAACKEFNVPYHYKSSFTEVSECSG